MNINNRYDNEDNVIRQHQFHQVDNNFKIKGYSGTTFLYSNWTFSFLLVVQLVAFGFFTQGLLIFFTYDTVYDWRIPVLWGGAVFSTLTCIFISMSSFANNFRFIKIGFLSIIASLIFTLLEITLLVITKKSIIQDLKYCSEPEILVSSCIPLFGQIFCGEYIKIQCQYTTYGFKKILLSQASIALVDAFLIIFAILKLFREEKRKKNNYQLLPTE
ncbi:hypothetical protein DICPUDRAFT_57022 [Dictyostelium purpureum]|uniref:MARVEL domain-containing protein n=1 Tax=Dictyostelium purpureum TaxID=5786 RepID=F0ZTZ3_DICPU|nr:uncharacterized protein DICPUDRAFT_57022 [Dictyostelium purpureum]EGC32588.1 hypothetical protein DICPUDRAFT_57022 [Dictyostelium purpureum]|eukprot:XP_003290879.1 hypothetical protein DICPUDRAFT_57022 [Dictyostelium purpureum]